MGNGKINTEGGFPLLAITMKIIFITLLALSIKLIFAKSNSENDELAKIIMYSNYMSATEFQKKNCIFKGYIELVDGSVDASMKILEKCESCLGDSILNYYCSLARHNALARKLDFYSSANELSVLIRNLSEFLPDCHKLRLETRKTIFENTRINKKGDIKVELIDDEFLMVNDVGGRKVEYMVDTAAYFNAVNIKECKDFNVGASVTNFAGEEEMKTLCFMGFQEGENVPFYLGGKKNIVGLIYLSSYDNVYFNQVESMSALKMKLDGEIIYVLADIEVANMQFTQVKACLDTGAKSSSLLPSMYKNLRKQFLDIPIKKIAAKTSFGTTETLGKIVDKVSLVMNNNQYSLNNIPIYFRNNAFYQCDMVLGMDVLKDLAKLSFKESKIYFRGSS